MDIDSKEVQRNEENQNDGSKELHNLGRRPNRLRIPIL